MSWTIESMSVMIPPCMFGRARGYGLYQLSKVFVYSTKMELASACRSALLHSGGGLYATSPTHSEASHGARALRSRLERSSGYMDQTVSDPRHPARHSRSQHISDPLRPTSASTYNAR